jgi:hypothetical protein
LSELRSNLNKNAFMVAINYPIQGQTPAKTIGKEFYGA